MTKTHQKNIRLTEEQDRLFKQYCVRNNLTTQEAIIDALRRLIPGF